MRWRPAGMRSYPPNVKKGTCLFCGMALAASAIVAQTQMLAAATQSTANAQPANSRVLNVTTLDEKGRPVTDLTSADFQIFDDGKPQKITDFFPPLPPTPGIAASTALICGRSGDTLQQLADISGGREYLHGEIDQAITESLQQASARYQLGYDAPRARRQISRSPRGMLSQGHPPPGAAGLLRL